MIRLLCLGSRGLAPGSRARRRSSLASIGLPVLAACLGACSPGGPREDASPALSELDESAKVERALPAEALSLLRAQSAQLSHRHRVEAALARIDGDLGRWLSPDGTRVLSPDEIEVRRLQASLISSLSRPEEALAVLEPLVARSGDARARALLALTQLDLRRHADAVKSFEGLPRQARAEWLVSFGRALVGSGREEEGIAALVAALIRDPWDHSASLWLGKAFASTGRDALARERLEAHAAAESSRQREEEAKAFEFAGEEARALGRRARMERERGRLFEAMQLYRAALARSPGLVDAYLGLAQISLFLEHPDDVLEALFSLPRRGPVLRTLATAQEAIGDRPAAIATLREAAAEDPGDPAIEGELARLLASRDADRAAQAENADADADANAIADTDAEGLEAARRSVRARVRHRPISRSVPELLELVAAYRNAGRAREARELALYLFRLAPADQDVARELLAVHAGDEHRFVRLHALSRCALSDRARLLDDELIPLGVRRDVVLRHLAP